MLMLRWPQMVGVVTFVPEGHLFDPFDVKVTSAPLAVEMPYRSESQASRETNDDLAADVGDPLLKSPMRQTSWV